MESLDSDKRRSGFETITSGCKVEKWVGQETVLGQGIKRMYIAAVVHTKDINWRRVVAMKIERGGLIKDTFF